MQFVSNYVPLPAFMIVKAYQSKPLKKVNFDEVTSFIFGTMDTTFVTLVQLEQLKI